MDHFLYWLSLLPGVSIAGVVGGLCSAAAVLVQNGFSRRNEARREKAMAEAFLLTVNDELKTLWQRFMDGTGAQLAALPDGEPFLVFLPVYRDYFTYYNGNSHILSHIESGELRHLIVRTYTIARAFMDSFRANNELLQRYRFAETVYRHSDNRAFKDEADAVYELMANYAATLKSRLVEVEKLERRMSIEIELALTGRNRRRRNQRRRRMLSEPRSRPGGIGFEEEHRQFMAD